MPLDIAGGEESSEEKEEQDIQAMEQFLNAIPSSAALSAPATAARPCKLWYDEIKAIYGATSTGNEYTRYNNLFQAWHNREHGRNVEITEAAVRKYVQQ